MREVYIVVIVTEQMDTKVGAAYNTREEADAEVARLQNANPYTQAYWVIRNLP